MSKKNWRADDWVWTVTRPSSVWEALLERGVSKALAAQLAADKLLFVDGKLATTRTMLCGGEELRLQMPKEHLDHEPIVMPLTILYEDADIVVIDKPVGITVNSQGQTSLANGVAALFRERKLHRKIRFVNRLDRDTSGCIMIAKSALAQAIYQKQLENHTMQKWYEAWVDGHMMGADTVCIPIGRAEDGIHQEVRADGKMTETYYEVKEMRDHPPQSRVRILLRTGKTHQIRVTMAHLGHPLVGDCLYGGSAIQPTFSLRAQELIFVSARTGEPIRCEAPMLEIDG